MLSPCIPVEDGWFDYSIICVINSSSKWYLIKIKTLMFSYDWVERVWVIECLDTTADVSAFAIVLAYLHL